LKKLIGIALVLAVVASLTLGSAVFAADPTEVDITWDGSGEVGGSVAAGDDANASFYSGSVYQVGEFHAIDNNDNPYGYGVDSCTFSLETSLNDAGEAWLEVSRTDAESSGYGDPGQQSLTYVGFEGGSATLQNRSSTNYASMEDCNYGWHANDHITVTGASSYYLQRYMDSGATNYAEINASGVGDVDLDCMSSEASEGQVRLGWGCGCKPYSAYDGFSANGTGTVELKAWGDSSATTAAIPGMTGAQSFDIVANWVGGSFSLIDYYMTAD